LLRCRDVDSGMAAGGGQATGLCLGGTKALTGSAPAALAVLLLAVHTDMAVSAQAVVATGTMGEELSRWVHEVHAPGRVERTRPA
jgi:hypothetical protein